MLSRIFPRQIDNTYRGHWLGIGLLAVIVLLKGIQGVSSIVDTRDMLTTADGIPLDSYGAAGAETVIALTTVLGLYLLVVLLMSLVVLIRYRAMIPLMFLMLLILQVGNRVLLQLNPIERTSTTSMAFAGQTVGFWVNMGMLAATLLGLFLSLQNSPENSASMAKEKI